MSLNKNYHFKQPLTINPGFQGNANTRENQEMQNKINFNNNNNNDPRRINAPTNNFHKNSTNATNQIKINPIPNHNHNPEENYNNNVNKILNDLNYLRNANSQNKFQSLNNNYNSTKNVNNPIALGNPNPNFNVTKNKFSMNFNLPNPINPQERVVVFGQDKSENSFKKTLRNGAANLLQNNYNIINHNPIPNTAFNGSLRGGIPNINNNNIFPEQNQQIFSAGKNNNNITGFNNYGTNLNNYSSNSYSKDSSPGSTYEKNVSCVKEFSYKEDPNPRFRAGMEDMARTIDKFNGNPNMGLFAIFDGHGGGEIAKYLKNRLPDVVARNLSPINNTDEYNYDIENTLINTFHKIDEEIKMTSESEYMGSTAVVVLISKERDHAAPLNAKRVIYCANVGDSRCVLVSNNGVKRLSYDHKASDPSEIDRVNKSGGIIFNGRVFGQLIITRAFGDNSLKRYGVTATPYISKNFINENDKYLVLASDGVWDVIEDEELFKLSKSVSNSDEFAKLILKTSLLRGTQDNISCIVMKL